MSTQATGEALEWLRSHNPFSQAELWRQAHGARMYALSLGDRWLKPDKRFMIVTTGRTGSELLVDLLNSQPGIFCDGEILNDRRLSAQRFVAGRSAKAAMGGAEAYGCKLVQRHFGFQPTFERDDFLRRMHDQGYHLIYLRRENILAQALSAAIGRHGRWHWHQGDKASFTPATIDPVELLGLAFLFDECDQYLQFLLEPLTHLSITYEDDLVGPAAQQATVDRICARLEMASVAGSTKFVRLSPRLLEDRLVNYDEVAAVVGASRFAKYLSDVSA